MDPGSWDPAAIIVAVRDWAALVGRAPRAHEWSSTGAGAGSGAARWLAEHPRWPSAGTVVYHFGCWSDALRAAGLPALIVEHELPRRERVATAVALRAAGESVRSIAEQLGVHLRTAHRYLAAGTCAGCGGPALYGERCRECAPRNGPAATREEIVAALHAWSAEHGAPAREQDWSIASAVVARRVAALARRRHRAARVRLLERRAGSRRAADPPLRLDARGRARAARGVGASARPRADDRRRARRSRTPRPRNLPAPLRLLDRRAARGQADARSGGALERRARARDPRPLGALARRPRGRRAERGQLPPLGRPTARPGPVGLVDPAALRRLLERRSPRRRPAGVARRAPRRRRDPLRSLLATLTPSKRAPSGTSITLQLDGAGAQRTGGADRRRAGGL